MNVLLAKVAILSIIYRFYIIIFIVQMVLGWSIFIDNILWIL